ncbi:MAG: ArsO family NAD(P)H-dependent flavin-containing monooxygenase [Anditalea sp.]
MKYDVIIIGGGQSGLASAYFLRRSKLKYVILDSEKTCGGSWQHAWDSLTLFSPSEYSSLPGWLMPKSDNMFPARNEVIDYLCRYEERYKFPVERPVEVKEVKKVGGSFQIIATEKTYVSRSVISATGTWNKPNIPNILGKELFKGKQFHSANYKIPAVFQDQKVLIVGEGNSGAQILAEVSKVAKTVWSTLKAPEFLSDDVDGRVLFDVASDKYYAEQKGEKFNASQYNLGNIVMVPSVKEARARGVLTSKGHFTRIYKDGVIWEDGTKEAFDSIIWCTGFGYSTAYLSTIVSEDEKGKIRTNGTRAVEVDGLWLVGYGGWTGYASATLIGVGRSAKHTVKEVEEYLKN